MASLENQLGRSAAHPLLMGLEDMTVGMQQLGRDSTMMSRFYEADPTLTIMWDSISTEDYVPIVDEDSGEELRVE